MDPRVTVIVPTYNRAGVLDAAIESVFGQTLRDWELIVVDDESTDDTAERMGRYAGRLQYVKTSHAGPAHARNIGMRLARGEYVAFLDSDDLYYPHKLELQVRLLDRFPGVGMVYTEFSAFDDLGFFEQNHLRTYHESGYRGDEYSYDTIFPRKIPLVGSGLVDGSSELSSIALGRYAYLGRIFDAYLLRTVVFTNSMMFRRTLIDRVGLQDESFRLFEELEFAMRVCRVCDVAFMDIPTYKLRYHPGQLSGEGMTSVGYTAIRKQQFLLRAIKRHALMDAAYYDAHRERIDRCLARLHCVAGIAMMAFESPDGRRRRTYARRARPYLLLNARYRVSGWSLWALSFAPSSVRRVALGLRRRWAETRRRTGFPNTSADARPRLEPQTASRRAGRYPFR